MSFPRLFSPLVLGPVVARNRIVCGAHFTMYTEPSRTYGEPGFYGERYGRYLAEYARGGVGTVIAGQAQVHPTTAYQMHNNAAVWDPACVPLLVRVAEQIREHGALAFLQLAHNGGVNHATWSRLPVWSASGIANHMEPSKQIERDEIREVVEHFGRSARHAADAGFDGIEVHGAHGYLIHEFLSPEHNRRTDEYGGSFGNRLRFAVEVLESVREAVGRAVAVGVRLVGDEEARDGHGLGAAECGEIAAELASWPRRLRECERRHVGDRHGPPDVLAASSRCAGNRDREEVDPRRAGLRGPPDSHSRRGGRDPRTRRSRRGDARPGADRRSRVAQQGAANNGPRRFVRAQVATRAVTGTSRRAIRSAV